ncbi:MAG: hypothetical protein KU28_11025 [Sulfurovum sp. PC08-66]|jgi:hypothetical protein|nr:MAG: hypothetical protein KU28_11025 [Sulfurovum sp. PC08-66]
MKSRVFKGIKAYVRMEERYEGLNILFETNNDLKEDIYNVIDAVKKETGLTPFIFEKISTDRKDIQAIYIEFHDDVHRTGGDFFEMILKRLNVDHCEDNICEPY